MFTQLVLLTLVISSIALLGGIVIRRIRWQRKLAAWRRNWTLPTATAGVKAECQSGDVEPHVVVELQAAADPFVRSPQILHRLVTAN